MATIVTDTMTEEAPQWRLDEIIRLVEERRVGSRAAARIIEILLEQPYVNETLGNQTEVARELRKWTQNDNSHG
jgi:hypothetical protein